MMNRLTIIIGILAVIILIVTGVLVSSDGDNQYKFDINPKDGDIVLVKPSLLDSNQEIEAKDKIEEFKNQIGKEGVSDYDTYLDISLIYNRLGMGEEAIGALLEATKLEPQNPTAYRNIGTNLVKYGAYYSAIDVFEDALSLEPESVSTNLLLLDTYSFVDIDNDQVISLFEEALVRTGRDRQILGEYARWLESKRIYDKALVVYEELLDKTTDPELREDVEKDIEFIKERL